MKDIEVLLDLMARLRDPLTGCPWDQQQNFHSIAPYTIEEAYEVADAIERKAMDELKDELGDLLFQVVFHCQLARESGLFEFTDVVEAIVDKMTRRHPHVFADAQISDSQQQTKAWEAIKHSERQAQGKHSLLDNIPLSLPALKRAEKIQKRVARAGFDGSHLAPVIAKVREELNEIVKEIESPTSARSLEEQVGDLLFACTNLARHLTLDPEESLRKANNTFVKRFRSLEHHLETQGRALHQLSAEEIDDAWQQITAKERAS